MITDDLPLQVIDARIHGAKVENEQGNLKRICLCCICIANLQDNKKLGHLPKAFIETITKNTDKMTVVGN